MAVDLAVSIPTLVGSILSALATGFVLLIFAISPKTHLRHWLILNLTIADFLNSTNNTVSGILVVTRHRDLDPGPGCQFNGWIGQFTVQAIDFSILAIGMVALWIVQRPTTVSSLGWVSKVILCISIWIIPLVTSLTALSLDILGPVSGNWCWIESRYLGLRYALGHGWRIAIVFITAGTYIVVFIVVKRRYKHLKLFPTGDTTSGCDTATTMDRDPVELLSIRMDTTVTIRGSNALNHQASLAETTESPSRDRPSSQVSYAAKSMEFAPSCDSNEAPPDESFPSQHKTSTIDSHPMNCDSPWSRDHRMEQRDKKLGYVEVHRVMLLNGYPVFYVLLWLPGLLNRLMESLGCKVQWLQILQASTQFVGLANALTYSYNEGFRRQIQALFTRQRVSYHERL
ncbi:hypothetical protein BDV28DRAFT_148324 [Aspergillus coremiiformis]|uniref:Glucose receptor Git3-like N-terminal domain-containing protein n=1 Tax=Aspergillus coremiiformis TaxID=138285 RepID=A0A5N6Z694_9EURO|nr:hypothetical protein BDV28DRAFT_148324 [Aspergillus coremiiformis]